MSLASADVIRWGRERARTGRWRGDAEVAFINPMPDAPLPSAEFLRRCLETLASRGYRRVVTGALHGHDAAQTVGVVGDLVPR